MANHPIIRFLQDTKAVKHWVLIFSTYLLASNCFLLGWLPAVAHMRATCDPRLEGANRQFQQAQPKRDAKATQPKDVAVGKAEDKPTESAGCTLSVLIFAVIPPLRLIFLSVKEGETQWKEIPPLAYGIAFVGLLQIAIVVLLIAWGRGQASPNPFGYVVFSAGVLAIVQGLLVFIHGLCRVKPTV